MDKVDSPIERLEWRSVEELKPNPNNPRIHPESAIARLRGSIDFYGFVNPILILDDGRMIAGHARRKAVQEEVEGDSVPCLVLDMTLDEAESYMIADNRLGAFTEWDSDSLEELVEPRDEQELEVIGFDREALDDLLNGTEEGAGVDYEPGSLSRDFGIPPISIFDTRQGYWTERRQEWDERGIYSYKGVIGREEGLLGGSNMFDGTWQRDVGKENDSLGANYDGTSSFDPVLAEILIKWFTPSSGTPRVLDPYAGGPIRSMVAALVGREYVGVDISERQVEENQEYLEEMWPRLTRQRPQVLPEELDNTPETTPVESVEDLYFKREDKYLFAGVNGSKVRVYRHIVERENPEGLIGGIARVSPNHTWIAAVGKRYGLPVELHTAHGGYTEEMRVAEDLGATIVQHKPGYMTQVRSEARKAAESRDRWLALPLAGKSQVGHDLRVEQVESLKQYEDEFTRVVVPVGSGFTVSGVLEGIDRYDIDTEVLGVSVGIDPEETLDEYAPDDWRERDDFEIVTSELDYSDVPDETSLRGVELDPIYESKAIPFVEPGDLMWVVAIRETALPDSDPRAGITTGAHPDVPTTTDKVRPRWIQGDAAELDNLLPSDEKFDLIFSCPPYYDLEQYTDDPRDLSNKSWEDFVETYRGIIRSSVDRLRDNRFAAFVVSDIRDSSGVYRRLPELTIEAFTDCEDVELYNRAILINEYASLPARVRRYFEASRKLGRTHQNILVFYKGDPSGDTIRSEMGEFTLEP